MCFFAFFGAKIWPAAAGTGELARDLRDQTPPGPWGAGAGWDTALAKLGCVTVLAGLRFLMGHWHGARPGPGASLRVSDCPNVEDFVLVDEGL